MTMSLPLVLDQKLHFLHLYTLEMCLKLHVCMLKVLSLAMLKHTSTFHQDFLHIYNSFSTGRPMPPQAPLKTAYAYMAKQLYLQLKKIFCGISSRLL